MDPTMREVLTNRSGHLNEVVGEALCIICLVAPADKVSRRLLMLDWSPATQRCARGPDGVLLGYHLLARLPINIDQCRECKAYRAFVCTLPTVASSTSGRPDCPSEKSQWKNGMKRKRLRRKHWSGFWTVPIDTPRLHLQQMLNYNKPDYNKPPQVP
ncbi:unnamed protein product, partial [Mesorhabditis spiculigera]